MDTINEVELRDESIYPSEKVLKPVLGKSFELYTALLDLFEKYELHYEWRYYRDGKAWLCKVQKKKRTIVWMSAWKDFMQATIYFPERLLDTVLESAIKDATRKKILATKNVGRSKPCNFEVRRKSVLKDIEVLMKLKIESK